MTRPGFHVRSIIAAALLALASFAVRPASGTDELAPVHDDFAGQTFSPLWFPCRRDENEMDIVPVPQMGFRAADLTVHPRTDYGLYAGVFTLLGRHADCRSEPGGQYARDNFDERAELWEADPLVLSFGTEVWYRFAMYVDPRIPDTDVNRLVVGQWKQSGGHSPILAQRFKGRRFTITIEQDFEQPLLYKGIDECRILIAHDAPYPQSTSAIVDFPRTTWLTEPASNGGLLTAAVAHTRSDSIRSEVARAHPCAQDIEVTPLGLLPDPFGKWVTMLYHFRPGLDGSGLLEVWADGQPVAKATGRIGFHDPPDSRQYFKYGPYRNRAPYSTQAMLARFARGATRADVERQP